jgi:2-aminoadipate transaminase
MTETASNWLNELLSDRSNRMGTGSPTNTRSAADLVAYLSGGFPDPRSLPKSDLIEATRMALESDGEWALQYGSSAGDPVLIEQLLAKLKRDQGIEAGPENILITNGASQALNLITQMLVDPGDVVLSEAPTWTGAVRGFKVAGAEIREVDITPEGIDVDQLEAELNKLKSEGRKAKLFYMIPNFQNPTGVTNTLERRKRIVELAAEHDLPIVEDDAYSDLRFAGEKLPTLYTLDGGNRVMYMGTFSKIVAAGIRLGWAVANPDVISRMIALKSEGGTSPFASHVVASFASSGTLTEHIQELRGIYHTRRDALLQLLKDAMPEGTTWTVPEGGFFVWVTLPEGSSISKLAPAASAQGVAISPGPTFYYTGRGDNEMRLSYSFNDPDQIRQGVQILANLVKEQIG